jgi:hypothetical protein
MLDLFEAARQLHDLANRLEAGAVVQGRPPATFDPTAQLGGVAWAYRRGGFLDAVERVLRKTGQDLLPSADLSLIGRQWGYDGRGITGFSTGSSPSLELEQGGWRLTETGREIVADWRAFFARRD